MPSNFRTMNEDYLSLYLIQKLIDIDLSPSLYQVINKGLHRRENFTNRYSVRQVYILELLINSNSDSSSNSTLVINWSSSFIDDIILCQTF